MSLITFSPVGRAPSSAREHLNKAGAARLCAPQQRSPDVSEHRIHRHTPPTTDRFRSHRHPVLPPAPRWARCRARSPTSSATDLGATAVKAAVERAGVKGDEIDRIYMGCVLPAGLGQAPARQAAIKAGLPKSVQATTVNKVCGSGMQTVIMAEEALEGRQCRPDRRRRHGVDDQRALSAQEAPRRARASATTPPTTICSSTGSRTPMRQAARWAPSPRTPPTNIS